MHLPREPHGGHAAARDARRLKDATNAGDACLPPRAGVLLRPPGSGRQEGVLRGGNGQDSPAQIDEHSLGAGRANIETEKHAHTG